MNDTRISETYIAAIAQLRDAPSFLLELPAVDALCLLSAIQLLLRHPGLGDGPVSAVAHQIADKLQPALIRLAPDIGPFIAAGWHRDDHTNH